MSSTAPQSAKRLLKLKRSRQHTNRGKVSTKLRGAWASVPVTVPQSTRRRPPPSWGDSWVAEAAAGSGAARRATATWAAAGAGPAGCCSSWTATTATPTRPGSRPRGATSVTAREARDQGPPPGTGGTAAASAAWTQRRRLRRPVGSTGRGRRRAARGPLGWRGQGTASSRRAARRTAAGRRRSCPPPPTVPVPPQSAASTWSWNVTNNLDHSLNLLKWDRGFHSPGDSAENFIMDFLKGHNFPLLLRINLDNGYPLSVKWICSEI